MNKLHELIRKLCPNGVPYRELGKIAVIKNGKDYKHLQKGDIPVYGSGGIMTYVNAFVYDKPTVLIPRKGSLGNLFYVNTPFWNVDTIFYTEIDTQQLVAKYLYYVLAKEHLERLNKAGGVPSLTQSVLNKVVIPVPPIEVQEEIVKILDRFAEYAAELQAELQARQEQYEHYRDKLLNFSNINRGGCTSVTWMKMSEVCEIRRGVRVTRNHLVNDGNFPVFQNSLIPLGYFDKYNREGNKTFVICAGAAGEIGYSDKPFWAADDCFTIETEMLYDKYIYYFLLTKKTILKSRVRKASVPRLSASEIGKLVIPVPSPDVQERIVSVLDKFETLTSDLLQGLPAEIGAVQEQYEYYRNKLLSFPKNKISA